MKVLRATFNSNHLTSLIVISASRIILSILSCSICFAPTAYSVKRGLLVSKSFARSEAMADRWCWSSAILRLRSEICRSRWARVSFFAFIASTSGKRASWATNAALKSSYTRRALSKILKYSRVHSRMEDIKSQFHCSIGHQLQGHSGILLQSRAFCTRGSKMSKETRVHAV